MLRRLLLALALLALMPTVARADFGSPQIVLTDQSARPIALLPRTDGSTLLIYQVTTNAGYDLWSAIRPAGTGAQFATPVKITDSWDGGPIKVAGNGSGMTVITYAALTSGALRLVFLDPAIGFWSTPLALADKSNGTPSAAVNARGDIVVAWGSGANAQSVLRPGAAADRPAQPGGFTQPTTVFPSATGANCNVQVALDSSGNQVALCAGYQTVSNQSSTIFATAVRLSGQAWQSDEQWELSGTDPAALVATPDGSFEAFYVHQGQVIEAVRAPGAKTRFNTNARTIGQFDNVQAVLAPDGYIHLAFDDAEGNLHVTRGDTPSATSFAPLHQVDLTTAGNQFAVRTWAPDGALFTGEEPRTGSASGLVKRYDTSFGATTVGTIPPLTTFAPLLLAPDQDGGVVAVSMDGIYLTSRYGPTPPSGPPTQPTPTATATPPPGATATATPGDATPIATPGPAARGPSLLNAGFGTRQTATIKLAQGKTTSIYGRLRRADGSPIPGATVVPEARISAPGSKQQQFPGAETAADGTFRIRVAAGPSRTISLFTAGDQISAPADLTLRLSVTAKLTVSAPKHARRGQRLTIAGRLLGAPYPARGVRVQLQAYANRRWLTFRQPRTGKNGRFSAPFAFNTSGTGTYKFRARLLSDDKYAYGATTSKPITVRVS